MYMNSSLFQICVHVYVITYLCIQIEDFEYTGPHLSTFLFFHKIS